MSLDVFLKLKEHIPTTPTSGIYVRRNGQTVEITEEEWNSLYPDREPVRLINHDTHTDVVYHSNITHNLRHMAKACGLYEYLWDCKVNVEASSLITPLARGLLKLIKHPEQFEEFNPKNGWGSYDVFVKFVRDYLEACIENPEAKVFISA